MGVASYRHGRERWVVVGAAINGVVRSRLTYPGHREGIGSTLVRARGAGYGPAAARCGWNAREQGRPGAQECTGR